MHCPKCGYPMYCGCSACADHVPNGYKPEVMREVETPNGTMLLEACANCGFEMPDEWWLDLEDDILCWKRREYQKRIADANS